MPTATPLQLPLLYRLFFLLIEPLSALVGAYYAYFHPALYLHLTNPTGSFSSFPPSTDSKGTLTPETTAALAQLANLYLLFALNEALVLRSTADLKVWKTVLLGLLVADLGHLWSVRELGVQWRVYWDIWSWNAMNWGNVGFVYLGAAMRFCFLTGVGLTGQYGKGRTKKSS